MIAFSCDIRRPQMRVTLENIESCILPLVSRPNRYLGNYEGAYRKSHDRVRVRVALAFPDCFDLGMSHLGIKILYRIINEREDALAELVFAPWPDMEEKMREHGLPLFALESRTPLSDFDVIGFSLQYELHYTTVLNMLDLAGVPVHSKDRGEDDPIVIAGGPCAFSPEPMAPFIDAFLVGDGEDATGAILDLVADRREGRSRDALLEELAGIEGVYVPSLYETEPNSTGHLIPRPRRGAPEAVRAARIRTLGREKSRPAHIVPLNDIAHDRLSVEVMRGCPRSCRFCLPGFVYRPVRRKSEEDVLVELKSGMESGGWEEVSLLSLSTSDYKGITPLVREVSKMFLGRGVNVSLPSIRPGTLPPQLARTLTYVRRSGLTFAPEAGTERLRGVIDKGITETEMVESVKVAGAAGWNSVKLYFMVGLPTETVEDVLAIAGLVSSLKRAARSSGSKMGLKVSVAGFVPKVHTPFQWESQLGMEEMASRISALNRAMKSKGIRLRWRDVETTYLEGLLSRGDRRLSAAVYSAWRGGCRFDGWTDQLDFDAWKRAIEEASIDPASYLGSRDPGEAQPWSHIIVGRSREALLKDRDRAYSEQPDRSGAARTGGRLPFFDARLAGAAAGEAPVPSPSARPGRSDAVGETPVGGEGDGGTESGSGLKLYGRGRKRPRQERRRAGRCFRLQYEKGEPVRFISHLDLIRVFDRALRRAGLPVAFSEGFSKHPRLAFGPPLALGMTSVAEYLDIEFAVVQTASFADALNTRLPEGLRVLRAEPQQEMKPASLMSSISRADYAVRFPECVASEIDDSMGPGSVVAAFRAARELLAGHEGAASSGLAGDEDWTRTVEGGSAEWGESGPLLLVSVRLDVKKGPKIGDVVKGLLAPLKFDPRLLRVERRALWVAEGGGLLSPFEALSSGGVQGRLEGRRA
jgi:radical SAM family uncharacterized protein